VPDAICQTTVQPVVLSVGQRIAIDPQATEGCVMFSANPSSTDSMEYLLVPQVTAENPDYRSSFKLAGGVPVSPAPGLAALYQEGPPSAAQEFHYQLRELERTRGWGASAGAPPAAASPQQAVGGGGAAAPIVLGSRRVFKVLSSLAAYPLKSAQVVAFAQSIGQHVVIYVDSAAPANGLTQADVDAARSTFDTLLYVIDTTAFGRESDIDQNGLVLVLMSNVINKLVTDSACQATGFIGGFFFAADIDPGFAAQWNKGEIFYSMVADSGRTLSCSHPNSQVKRLLPVTFIHEFQHMISYNQHVLLRGGPAEVLWLNEGMSHYAEERGARSFLAAGDNARFCDHVLGDLLNFASYLTAPGPHALVDTSGTGGLPERGADWAFVRYLVDQYASDTNLAAADAFTRRIDQTATTGTANVAEVTGEPFAAVAERWALANWVSDLSGFTTPDSLKYKHWAFRSAYPTLHASCSQRLPNAFPLVAVASAGPAIGLSGTMWSGSGAAYQRALQGPGDAGFALLFSDGTGRQLNQVLAPRLNLLRIR